MDANTSKGRSWHSATTPELEAELKEVKSVKRPMYFTRVLPLTAGLGIGTYLLIPSRFVLAKYIIPAGAAGFGLVAGYLSVAMTSYKTVMQRHPEGEIKRIWSCDYSRLSGQSGIEAVRAQREYSKDPTPGVNKYFTEVYMPKNN